MSNSGTPSNYLLIKKAIEYINGSFREQPSIEQLAKHVGMSKYHFIRTFREYVGLTPKRFIHSMTLNYAKVHIKNSKSLLEGSLDMGLSSSSRLHELFVGIIGVTPKEWREKGTGVRIVYGRGATPFGNALVACTQKGICYLGFLDAQSAEAVYEKFFALWENAELVCDDAEAERVLGDIFAQNLGKKEPNLQINIWKALLNASILSEGESEEAIKALIPCYKEVVKSGVISTYPNTLRAGEASFEQSCDRAECNGEAVKKEIATMERYMGRALYLKIGGVSILKSAKSEITSAIKKYPVCEVYATKSGFIGDVQADRLHHGGENKAVLMFSTIAYNKINSALHTEFAFDGAAYFGENIVVSHIDEHTVCVGDLLQIGDALMEVSQPREPCKKLSIHTGVPAMSHFIYAEGLSGWYARVVCEGHIGQNDTVVLLGRSYPNLTVINLNTLLRDPKADRKLYEEAVRCEALGAAFKASLMRRFAAEKLEEPAWR